jgi:hypothetical protein
VGGILRKNAKGTLFKEKDINGLVIWLMSEKVHKLYSTGTGTVLSTFLGKISRKFRENKVILFSHEFLRKCAIIYEKICCHFKNENFHKIS